MCVQTCPSCFNLILLLIRHFCFCIRLDSCNTMPSLLNFLTALCGFLSLLSGCVAVTRIENGTVEIYSDTNYKNRLLTINL
ncbi:hypothetical protein PF004_g27913, partial [Phytophthora fragariae]